MKPFITDSNKESKNEHEKVKILNAAKEGDIDIIQKYPTHKLQSITDSSGCTILHWACGNNHLPLLRHLLISQIFEPDIAVKSRKAKGRTPLHYAARNGHLEIVKTLVEEYGANIFVRAKHGVTAFQLAVWQNQLHVCQYLASKGVVPKQEVNDFGCGIIHWMGISPLKRTSPQSVIADTSDDFHHDIGTDNETTSIVQLARWIFSQEGIDIKMRQSQGRTVLHKASWGGHFDLVKYLHEEHGMYDDIKDHAGNYAADLCDMANTKRHSVIATYLRRECSLEFRDSCDVLGLDRERMLSLLGSETDSDGKERQKIESVEDIIRRAYLSRAKECHPDKKGHDHDFQAVKKAYEHLRSGGLATKQQNPMHSIHLMLEVQKKNTAIDNER